MSVAAKSKGAKPAPAPKGASVASSPAGTELRLKQRYQDKILPALIQRFAYTNALQVPRLVKVVANIGIGEGIPNPNAARPRHRGSEEDHRPAARDHEIAEGDRELQAARRPADRDQGDVARRPHGSVRRQADLGRE